MSASKYNLLQDKIGMSTNNIATMSAQFSFNALDGIKSGTTQKFISKTIEQVTSGETTLTEAQEVVIAHAAKGTDWYLVRKDINQMDTTESVDSILDGAIRNVNK